MNYLIIASAILWSSVSHGKYSSAFNNLNSAEYSIKNEIVNLTNLPRVRSQDGFGACVGFSTATVLQHYICKKNRISDCAKVPMNQEVSPFAMLGFANRNNDRMAEGRVDSHTNIQFGGYGYNALSNFRKAGIVLAESCYPFDRVANKYGSDEKAVDKMLQKLEGLYKKHQATEANTCIECVKKEIQTSLLSSPGVEKVKIALGRDTFAEFLYESTVESSDRLGCDDLFDINPPPNFGIFPDRNASASTPQVISKIKDVLKSGNVLNLSNICPYKENGNCLGRHDVVLTGYRKQCTPSGKCREMVRVHNSWGKEWQDRNDDGWVIADDLLENKSHGTGTLSWLY